jgi:hypothetical protein
MHCVKIRGKMVVPVIPGIWEVEMEKSQFEASIGQKHETLSEK